MGRAVGGVVGWDEVGWEEVGGGGYQSVIDIYRFLLTLTSSK